MATWMFLLLTILTPPGVPWPGLPDETMFESPLRVSDGGVPLVAVELAPGHRAWFAVDTGATGTTLASDMAATLGLVPTGQARLTTLEGGATTSTVRVPALKLDGVPVTHEVDAAVHDLALVRRVAPQADGILGQDVLARYDYLLDLARKRLRVGRFGPPAAGVRLPLSWSAGRPVLGIAARGQAYGLVLDSGADALLMEETAAGATVGNPLPAARSRAVLETHVGRRTVDVEHHDSLRLDVLDLPAVPLVRLSREAWPMSPEVGLLPASLFSRVYVSGRTGVVVVWRK